PGPSLPGSRGSPLSSSAGLRAVKASRCAAPLSPGRGSAVRCEERQWPQGPALEGEKRGLHGETTSVAGEAAVRTDHAMAGDDDRDRVPAVGGADGAHRARPPDLPRERAVGDGLAERDLSE